MNYYIYNQLANSVVKAFQASIIWSLIILVICLIFRTIIAFLLATRAQLVLLYKGYSELIDIKLYKLVERTAFIATILFGCLFGMIATFWYIALLPHKNT